MSQSELAVRNCVICHKPVSARNSMNALGGGHICFKCDDQIKRVPARTAGKQIAEGIAAMERQENDK